MTLATDRLDRPGAWMPFTDLDESPHPWEMHIDENGQVILEAEGHQLIVASTLVERERTADRYWSLFYEPVDEEWEDGRGRFHVGTSANIARNNLLRTMEMLTGDVVAAMDGPADPDPHWVVHKTLDLPDTRVPNAALADQIANFHTRRGLDAEDGPYRVHAVDDDLYHDLYADDGGEADGS